MGLLSPDVRCASFPSHQLFGGFNCVASSRPRTGFHRRACFDWACRPTWHPVHAVRCCSSGAVPRDSKSTCSVPPAAARQTSAASPLTGPDSIVQFVHSRLAGLLVGSSPLWCSLAAEAADQFPDSGAYVQPGISNIQFAWAVLIFLAIPVGIYYFMRVVLWDYKNRRSDDPNPRKDGTDVLWSTPFQADYDKTGAQLQRQTKAVTFQAAVFTQPSALKDPRLQMMAYVAAHSVTQAARSAQEVVEKSLASNQLNSGPGVQLQWGAVQNVLQQHNCTLDLSVHDCNQAMQPSDVRAVTRRVAAAVAEQAAVEEIQKLCTELESLDFRSQFIIRL